MSQTFKPCEVLLDFGDGEHLFRLPLRMLAELQERRQAGLGAIYKRVMLGDFYAEDLVETIRCGLIGGGMEGPAAKKMIERYCSEWPVEIWHTHAIAILGACLHGYEDKSAEGKPKATVSSTSPSPSAEALSTESDQIKSAA